MNRAKRYKFTTSLVHTSGVFTELCTLGMLSSTHPSNTAGITYNRFVISNHESRVHECVARPLNRLKDAYRRCREKKQWLYLKILKKSFRGVISSRESVVVSCSNQNGLQSTKKNQIGATRRHDITILNWDFREHISHFFMVTYIVALPPTRELHCYQLSLQYISHSMLTQLELNHVGLQMKSKIVELKVLLMTSVLCSNHGGEKASYFSITSSELHLESTGSLMTLLLYLHTSSIQQLHEYICSTCIIALQY